MSVNQISLPFGVGSNTSNTSNDEIKAKFENKTSDLLIALESLKSIPYAQYQNLKYRLFKAIPIRAISENLEQIQSIEEVFRNQNVFCHQPCTPTFLAVESSYWLGSFSWPEQKETMVSDEMTIEDVAKEYLILNDEKREEYIQSIEQVAVLLELIELADFWQVDELKEDCLAALQDQPLSMISNCIGSFSESRIAGLRVMAQHNQLLEVEHCCLHEELKRKGPPVKLIKFYDLYKWNFTYCEQIIWDKCDYEILMVIKKYPQLQNKIVLNEQAVFDILSLLKTLPQEERMLPFQWIQFDFKEGGNSQMVSAEQLKTLFSCSPQLKSVEVCTHTFDELFISENGPHQTFGQNVLEAFASIKNPFELLIGLAKSWGHNIQVSYIEKLVKCTKNDNEVEILEKLQLLKDAGITIDFRDINGNGPLHCCVTPILMKFLLDTGLSPDHQNKFGRSPLHSLSRLHPKRMIPLANMLLSYGGDLDCENKRDCQPLHTFIKERWLDYEGGEKGLQWFLDNDADIISGGVVNALSFICEYGPQQPSDALKKQIVRMIDEYSLALLSSKQTISLRKWGVLN
jgi:hypothetical protein